MSDGNERFSFFGTSELSCTNLEDCAENEVCIKTSKTSNIGTCECTLGYKRNLAGMKLFTLSLRILTLVYYIFPKYLRNLQFFSRSAKS
jgi:hypothetical protein